MFYVVRFSHRVVIYVDTSVWFTEARGSTHVISARKCSQVIYLQYKFPLGSNNFIDVVLNYSIPFAYFVSVKYLKSSSISKSP